MIRLVGGGQHNGVLIEDSGTVIIKMGIASETTFEGRPVPGARTGFAIYEPNNDRSHAFWLDNVWEGTCIEVID